MLTVCRWRRGKDAPIRLGPTIEKANLPMTKRHPEGPPLAALWAGMANPRPASAAASTGSKAAKVRLFLGLVDIGQRSTPPKRRFGGLRDLSHPRGRGFKALIAQSRESRRIPPSGTRTRDPEDALAANWLNPLAAQLTVSAGRRVIRPSSCVWSPRPRGLSRLTTAVKTSTTRGSSCVPLERSSSRRASSMLQALR